MLECTEDVQLIASLVIHLLMVKPSFLSDISCVLLFLIGFAIIFSTIFSSLVLTRVLLLFHCQTLPNKSPPSAFAPNFARSYFPFVASTFRGSLITEVCMRPFLRHKTRGSQFSRAYPDFFDSFLWGFFLAKLRAIDVCQSEVRALRGLYCHLFRRQ